MAHSNGSWGNFIEGSLYRGVGRAEATNQQCSGPEADSNGKLLYL